MADSTKSNPKTRVTSISFDEEITPIYKKWWFWLLALVVVLIVTTVIFVLINGLLFTSSALPISPLAK